MKTIILAAAVVILVGGMCGLAARMDSKPDASELKQRNADRVMTRSYGADWVATYYNCGKTNREKQKVMNQLYKSALALHQ